MEDALVLRQIKKEKKQPKLSLNPCCNGRCTRTQKKAKTMVGTFLVLILVVMEDALAHGIAKGRLTPVECVLILVVMEDALAQFLISMVSLISILS